MIELEQNLKFTLQEIQYIKTRKKSCQLAFAILFKYYQYSYEFISDLSQVPQSFVNFVAKAIDVSPEIGKISARTYDNFYALIRYYFKTTFPQKQHYSMLASWIKDVLLPSRHISEEEIEQLSVNYLREKRIEPFKKKTIFKIIRNAINSYDTKLCAKLRASLSAEQEARLNGLLLSYKDGMSYLGWISKDFENPSLQSILDMIDQLSIINDLCITETGVQSLPEKRLRYHAETFTRLSPSHLKSQSDEDRYKNLVIYCYIRQQQITDKIIDMLDRISHNIIHKSEKRVIKKLVSQIQKVYGKDLMLFSIAETCLSDPDETIRKKIYPVVGAQKLQNIVNEYKKSGVTYQNIIHNHIRGSYARHYRRMVQPLLDNITFKCNNTEYQPILNALRLVTKYFDSGKKYFPENEQVPMDCIPKKWRKHIVDSEGKVKRICYEVYLLKALANSIKCREIWVEHSRKHCNPDKDLPNDFDDKKAIYFSNLGLPLEAEDFVASLKQQMQEALAELNTTIINNQKVKISNKNGGRIKLIPLQPQPEAPLISVIKKSLQDKWQTINLIDTLKEVQLNINFTNDFVSYGEKIYLTPQEISERILLAIYGFGTNVGLKHIWSGNQHITYNQLRHIKNYFLSTNNLKNAINKTANALFIARDKRIWGEMPIAIASDSTQFSAYFQNMTSEYHNRYGGRGVMIYWHVEKKATCIHSQLKSVSSSEIASMINGILNHCTEMSVQKSYVDTHGQSEIGFAFSHLLGFKLMPRLANLNKQKLYQCTHGDYKKYSNLQPILTDTIRWESIQDYYHEMVKYSVAMREGYANPESILRRFTKNNLTHPIYSALSQLGKVIKTIFICHYLMNESLRQEIHEGLNVVELWNGVSKFIFYGRVGEISTNREKSQELSVLSLHLLQLSMVYVNTMMIQQVIYESNLINELSPEDKRAITPLIYEHINPYGLFQLDLLQRLPHIEYRMAA